MRNDIPAAVGIFARNLDRLMKERDLVDRTLETKSGIGHKTINNMRNGRHAPNLDNIEAVARALQVEPWMLLVENAPLDLLRSGKLQRLMTNFLAADARQQESLIALAESAAQFNNGRKAG
jgi:transcriptional regulator with XRE-family HTH domain